MSLIFYGPMHDVATREEVEVPSRCAECGSSEIERTYHRDLIDCIGMQAMCGGEHLHWQCRNCTHDFTSSCVGGDDE